MANPHISINIDPADKILLKRSLNRNGAAQRFFTHEVRRLSDPYVPMLGGVLKDTAVENTDSIEYVQPYARRQYYENKGNGLRGKQWDKRMWAARGPEIVKSVAKFAGGK
ncbi:MAG: minor capsid protein [Lachnospiraceae bacterium]